MSKSTKKPARRAGAGHGPPPVTCAACDALRADLRAVAPALASLFAHELSTSSHSIGLWKFWKNATESARNIAEGK